MPDTDSSNPDKRRRRAVLRALGVASAAAFAGGVAVVGVQYALGVVSAGYPPVLHALTCTADGHETAGSISLVADGAGMIPVIDVPSPGTVTCRIDAPGADYATWSALGPVTGIRSGPLDASLPCQSPEDFADQDPSTLRLSTCQRMRAERPGTYLLSVTVMLRGLHTSDRARLILRVGEPVAAPAPPAATQGWRLSVALLLPAMETGQTREADLSASFGEHGLMPQSRAFERTVYRLAPEEEFVQANFHARSAANASAVRLAYVPQTRAVTAGFTLRSGSLIDRWRGWISGTVSIRVRRRDAAREIRLPDADLSVPGQARLALPEGVDAATARIVVQRPETATRIELRPGGAASLDGDRIIARMEDGALILEARRE
ncbi:hypothetical protein AAFN86_28565 [Roseomonas sp. CAU 1739]|uniref:hypothetical protein n=1 Tax=Roseomonas sp. CAU 1739 TaxID=3140364 RepID=UPI00325B8C2D